MVAAVSALSLGALRLRQLLLANFRHGGSTLQVLIGPPTEALRAMTGQGTASNIVNLYPFRVRQKGPADMIPQQAFAVSVFVLLTGIGHASGNDVSRGEADLRVMGEAMRVLHEKPVVDHGVLPLSPANFPTKFSMEVIFQDSPVEDLNHIWALLAGNEAYRLSAIYELSVIMIDPVIPLQHAPDVTQALGEVRALPAAGGTVIAPLPGAGSVKVDMQ